MSRNLSDLIREGIESTDLPIIKAKRISAANALTLKACLDGLVGFFFGLIVGTLAFVFLKKIIDTQVSMLPILCATYFMAYSMVKSSYFSKGGRNAIKFDVAIERLKSERNRLVASAIQLRELGFEMDAQRYIEKSFVYEDVIRILTIEWLKAYNQRDKIFSFHFLSTRDEESEIEKLIDNGFRDALNAEVKNKKGDDF